MLFRLMTLSVLGSVAGALAAVIAGGVCSVLIGQPFSGEKGLRVFPLGMYFPGLIVFGPAAASTGAIIGAVYGCLAQSRQ